MITYAGYPLLLPDPDGDLMRFICRHQPIEDLRLFGCEPAAARSPMTGTRGENASGVGLPLPNYPPPPALRINQLYWPTGATRWACGLFLCDSTTLASIESATANGRSATLKFGDEEQATLSTSMYLLPPRPVSGGDPTSDTKTLWLLPLVDHRYWWQFKSVGDPTQDTPDSAEWSAVYSAIRNGLGISLSEATVDSAYLKGDSTELARYHGNAALLLDAVAHSVGQRVIRDINGTTTTKSGESAAAAVTANAALDDWTRSAGDSFSSHHGNLPESIIVTFAKYQQGVAYCSGERHSYTISPASSSGVVSGAKKVIHSSALADFTDREGSFATPANDSKLNTLATSLAYRYEDWVRAGRFDMTFNGVKSWDFTGAEDHVLWTFGYQRPDGSFDASTRVQGAAYDFGVEQQLSQDPDLWIADGRTAIGVLDDDLDEDEEWVYVSIYTGKPGKETDTGENVKAFPWPHADEGNAIEKGSKVILVWHCTEGCWYIIHPEGDRQIYVLYPCKYEEQNKPKLYASNPELNQYVDHETGLSNGIVVRVGDTCYYVREKDETDPDCIVAGCVDIQDQYDECSECGTHVCWLLTQCPPNVATKKTTTNMARFKGRVVQLNDGTCWTVTDTTQCDSSARAVTVVADYPQCDYCGKCYELENCFDPDDFFETSTDLKTIGGFASPADVVGAVFKIGDACYTVLSWDTCLYGIDFPVDDAELVPGGCNATPCKCYRLTQCPPGTDVVKAYGGFNEDGVFIDSLEDYIGQIVRLDNGNCYTVARETTDCSGALWVVILEAYYSCSNCHNNLYLLSPCDGVDQILTYTDLAGLGYVVDDVLKDEDGKCWTIDADNQPWEDRAVGFNPVSKHGGCPECQKTIKYLLTDTCTDEICGEEAPSKPDIVTTTDLSSVVGKIVNVNGVCYTVSVATGSPTVTHASISFAGPYDDCDKCADAMEVGYTGEISMLIPCPKIDGTTIKFPTQTLRFLGGLLVGSCPDDDCTITGTECTI